MTRRGRTKRIESVLSHQAIESVRQLDCDTIIPFYDCDDADLNDFILHEAWPYQKARLSTTYILETSSGRIDGYFSLAATLFPD